VPGPATSWSVDLQSTYTFYEHIAELPVPGGEVSAALTRAFQHLHGYHWDSPNINDFYKVDGNLYIYRVHQEYLLAFELKIDRDRLGNPKLVTLELLALQNG